MAGETGGEVLVEAVSAHRARKAAASPPRRTALPESPRSRARSRSARSFSPASSTATFTVRSIPSREGNSRAPVMSPFISSLSGASFPRAESSSSGRPPAVRASVKARALRKACSGAFRDGVFFAASPRKPSHPFLPQGRDAAKSSRGKPKGEKRRPERKSAVSPAGHPSEARSSARRALFQRIVSDTSTPSFREKGSPYRVKLSAAEAVSSPSPQTPMADHPGKGSPVDSAIFPSPADQRRSSLARVSEARRRSPPAMEKERAGPLPSTGVTDASGNWSAAV